MHSKANEPANAPGGDAGNQPGVPRFAFFGGLFLGFVVAGLGFYVIPKLGLSGILALPFEILSVFIALQVTTRIWKRSVEAPVSDAPGDLDSRAVDPDRGEQ